jgi:hypothetical protein
VCYKVSVSMSSSQSGVIYHLACFLFLGLILLNFIIIIF